MDNKTSTADTVGSNQTSMSRDTADSSISSELVTESKDTSMVDLQRVPFQHLNASTTAIKSNNNSQQFIENVDSNENKDESSQLEGNSQGSLPIRRKSTLIFTDDAADFGKMKRNGQHNDEDEDDRMVIDNDPFNRSSQQQQQQQTQPPQQSQQPPPPQQQQQQQQQQLQDQQQQPQQQQQIQQQPPQQQQQLVPTVFKWTEGGSKVFVMGTFTGWRKMIALNGPNPKDGSFGVQIALPTGTHRFKFVVDNEVRISNFIPTATDSSGHFVNYLEVVPPSQEEERLWTQRTKSKSSLRTLDSKLGLTRDDDDMGDGYSRYHDEEEFPQDQKIEYITSIPPIFIDPKVMEEYYTTLDNNQRHGGHNQQWLIPPQLPPHLENVILNGYNTQDKDNTSGALNIPNHVVLNHLATTSIKHNTLAVASVVRYKRKYVTQILYAPLQ